MIRKAVCYFAILLPPSFSSDLTFFLSLTFALLAPFIFSYFSSFHFSILPPPPTVGYMAIINYPWASRTTTWNKTVSLVKCEAHIEREADDWFLARHPLTGTVYLALSPWWLSLCKMYQRFESEKHWNALVRDGNPCLALKLPWKTWGHCSFQHTAQHRAHI